MIKWAEKEDKKERKKERIITYPPAFEGLVGCVLSVGNVKGIIPEIVIINILLLIKCNIVMVAWCIGSGIGRVSAGLQVHVIMMVVVGALRSW